MADDSDRERPELTGLVLAGGTSRRMGRDKARIVIGGETLVERAVRRLGAVCVRVVVASADGASFPDLGVEEVADVVPGGGPLAGIVAGLEAARTDLVAVVAVDMPDASPDVLVALARQWRGEAAVVPLVDERINPLHGVYATRWAASLRGRLEDGRRAVVPALSDLAARVVGPEGWGEIDPAGAFARNLNRPEDVAELEKRSS